MKPQHSDEIKSCQNQYVTVKCRRPTPTVPLLLSISRPIVYLTIPKLVTFYLPLETVNYSDLVGFFPVQTQETYTLTIKGTDMNGRPEGLSGTGKVVIKIKDVNDNIPTLEKSYVRN